MNELTNYLTNLPNIYKLNQEEYNNIISKYQNDNRDINIIKKEIENACLYYQYQNKLLAARKIIRF